MKIGIFNIIAGAAILFGMAAPVYSRTVYAEDAEAVWCVPDSTGTVKVPSGLTVIPPYAFADRTDIRKVVFPSDSRVTEIGEYAFLGCVNLTDLSLPPSLSALGEGCLRECSALKTLLIPAKVKQLPRYFCAWCGSLETVILPPGLSDIGSHSFVYCASLRSVTTKSNRAEEAGVDIPGRVEHIGSNAFGNCSAMERVKLPASIKELESYAFAECTALREVILPANDCLLGELIFSGCRSLTDLYEPSTVPPKFDCSSFIFEPDEDELYARCRLHVPSRSVTAYQRAPGWRLFHAIIPTSSVPTQ